MDNGIQAVKLPNVYSNAGKRDKTLDKYFNMPEYVMREGKLINIRENNKALGVNGSRRAIKG